MIGNDIVDLKVAAKESNWRRKGFLQKLFNEKEIENILASPNPENFLWLLWSMKEAAYKAQQRQYNLERSYRPKSFGCHIVSMEDNSALGRVKCGENVYTTQSLISAENIHTIASSSEGTKIESKILPSSENIKSAFISLFAAHSNYCESFIKIVKDSRAIPHLTYKNSFLKIPFSFSHHGEFSAYSLSLMNY